VRSAARTGRPSTVTRSAAVTFTAGLVSRSPFSDTRPSAIKRSTSRREATPARASTLAIRSPA
jgi:hypothetical protein